MEVSHIEHLGIAVKSLDEAIPYWENVLGLKCYAIEEVPDQKVRTAFFKLGQTKIELLEPTSEDSTIAKYIENRGVGMVFQSFNLQVHREQGHRYPPHGTRRQEHRGAAGRRRSQGHPPDRQDPAQGRRRHDHRVPAPEIDAGHPDRTLRGQEQLIKSYDNHE